MSNATFGKTMEDVRTHRNIKLVTTERRRNYLVSELNLHTTKFFTYNLLAIEIKKTQILINKPVNLGFSIQDLSKTVMHEFWYDYVQPKYVENAKLCYIDLNIFIVFTKILREIVETRFDTSNFEIYRPLPKRKNKKVMKD